MVCSHLGAVLCKFTQWETIATLCSDLWFVLARDHDIPTLCLSGQYFQGQEGVIENERVGYLQTKCKGILTITAIARLFTATRAFNQLAKQLLQLVKQDLCFKGQQFCHMDAVRHQKKKHGKAAPIEQELHNLPWSCVREVIIETQGKYVIGFSSSSTRGASHFVSNGWPKQTVCKQNVPIWRTGYASHFNSFKMMHWSGQAILTKWKMFCVDYHKLNRVTHKDAYPLLRMDSVLDLLSSSSCWLSFNTEHVCWSNWNGWV